MSRKMRFRIAPKYNTTEFLMFMSQSNLKVSLDSESNEIIVEIPTESPAEVEKLLKNIHKTFDITDFSSGHNAHFLQSSQSETLDSDKKMTIDFSYLTEECSEKALTKLNQTLYWARVRKNVSEYDITRLFIWPILKEISLYYSSNDEVNFQVYDIVSIMNPSSIIDDKTYNKGIVCHISDNSFFVIPLTEDLDSEPFLENEIIFFDDELQKKAYQINFEAARYVAKRRVESIIGTVNPEFYSSVILENLNETFSFMHNVNKSNSLNVGIQEKALLEEFESAFEALSKSADFDKFFNELNLTDENLTNICKSCSQLDKINWHSINKISKISRDELKNAFRIWLDNQPELKEKCPSLSFTALLKVIKKYCS